MDKLLHDLGFAIEEKSTLADQVAALITQVHACASAPWGLCIRAALTSPNSNASISL